MRLGLGSNAFLLPAALVWLEDDKLKRDVDPFIYSACGEMINVYF